MRATVLRFVSIVAVCTATMSATHAAPVNLSGTFLNDNDRFQYDFMLSQASTVRAYTTSWAMFDGFSANLTLFGAPGGVQVNQGASNHCGSGNSVPLGQTGAGACWDASFSSMLDVGSYSLVLTQNGNDAVSDQLSDGFFQDGVVNSDYTAPGTGDRFVDSATSEHRTGNWTLLFDVSYAEPTAVPEPGTLPLAALALLGLLVRGHKRRGLERVVSRADG